MLFKFIIFNAPRNKVEIQVVQSVCSSVFVVERMEHNRRLNSFPIVTRGFNAKFKGLVNIAIITD